VGEPAEIYENPATRFIANFIGSANLIDTTIAEKSADRLRLQHKGSAEMFDVMAETTASVGAAMTIALRPEKILIDKTPIDHCDNKTHGVVKEIAYLGKISTYRVQTEMGETIEVTAPNQIRSRGTGHRIDWDDTVHLGWNADSAVLLGD